LRQPGARLLAATLPATAADDQARRDRRAAALRKRLQQIDAAENAHAREIEALTHDDHQASHQALTALRSRTLARFTELEDERAQIGTQLAEVAKTEPQAATPPCSTTSPVLADQLTDAPARLWQQLFHAFDLQALSSTTRTCTRSLSTSPSPPSPPTPTTTPPPPPPAPHPIFRI
jgi:hypothetical protein